MTVPIRNRREAPGEAGARRASQRDAHVAERGGAVKRGRSIKKEGEAGSGAEITRGLVRCRPRSQASFTARKAGGKGENRKRANTSIVRCKKKNSLWRSERRKNLLHGGGSKFSGKAPKSVNEMPMGENTPNSAREDKSLGRR